MKTELRSVATRPWWLSVVDALEWRTPADAVIDQGQAAFATVAHLGLARLRRRPSALADRVEAIPPEARHRITRSSLAPLLIFSDLVPEATSVGLLDRWAEGDASLPLTPGFSSRPHGLVDALRDDIGVELEWLGPPAAETAVGKAEQAFALIESTSALCAGFIRRCTHLVVLMGSPETQIGSVSHCQFAGLSLIINAHYDKVTLAAVADRIIHESIHDLLYMGHFAEPVLAPELDRDPTAVVVESPWTGRTLTLRNYLHACFVWYGLARFWELDTQVFPPDQRTQRRELAGSGFRAVSSLLAPLEGAVDLLSAPVRDALELLDDRARR